MPYITGSKGMSSLTGHGLTLSVYTFRLVCEFCWSYLVTIFRCCPSFYQPGHRRGMMWNFEEQGELENRSSITSYVQDKYWFHWVNDLCLELNIMFLQLDLYLHRRFILLARVLTLRTWNWISGDTTMKRTSLRTSGSHAWGFLQSETSMNQGECWTWHAFVFISDYILKYFILLYLDYLPNLPWLHIELYLFVTFGYHRHVIFTTS